MCNSPMVPLWCKLDYQWSQSRISISYAGLPLKPKPILQSFLECENFVLTPSPDLSPMQQSFFRVGKFCANSKSWSKSYPTVMGCARESNSPTSQPSRVSGWPQATISQLWDRFDWKYFQNLVWSGGEAWIVSNPILTEGLSKDPYQAK